jgi:hypothetical protein
MVDPKLNELPADSAKDLKKGSESQLTEEERAERLRRTRAGLSVNETIAADANLSVGARGADVSGVEAGAGAGKGMTYTTPGRSGSPAPDIVPGARGSGTTPRSDSASGQTPTTRLDAGSGAPTADEIAARAHQCWLERGCPVGSPEEDWNRAERELREQRQGTRVTAAGTK